MSYNYLPLDRKWLNFQQIKNLLDYNQQVSITFDAHERILKCRAYLDNISTNKEVSNDEINKGDEQTNHHHIEQLQYNLLKNHASGLGEEVPADIVKLVLMLKIKSLSFGHAGVQIDTVKRLMEMYNNEALPVIYTHGSGGDTAALSHLSLPLIGLGEVYFKGQKRQSSEVLLQLNWQPVILQSNEGLALITGTEFTSAYAMYALKQAERLLKVADAIAALSFDASGCSTEPFHEKIHATRGHNGQAETAAKLLKYLQGSETAAGKKTGTQNPYSFSSIPQVHGAAKDAFEYVLNIFLKEINSVTGSTTIFPDDNLILNGGSSTTQPLALALDFLAIAMSGLANISERRTSQLNSLQRELPVSVAKNEEINAGFKTLQFTAAAIVSENKQWSVPASVDSISGSNDHEDYVSMGASAAVKCLRLINNVEKVLAVELMSAVQALEFKRPAQTAPFLEQLAQDFRQQVSSANEDQVLHDDILKAVEFIRAYKL